MHIHSSSSMIDELLNFKWFVLLNLEFSLWHLASDYLKEIVLIFFNCCNIRLVRSEIGRLNYNLLLMEELNAGDNSAHRILEKVLFS